MSGGGGGEGSTHEQREEDKEKHFRSAKIVNYSIMMISTIKK